MSLALKPIEFIKKHLSELAVLFPEVTIRYKFDTVIDTHIVELTPQREYYNNKNLDNAWIPISLNFKDFFEEDIAFISSDSILHIEIPELVWNNEVEMLDWNYYNQLFTKLNTSVIDKFEFPHLLNQHIDLPNFYNHVASTQTSLSTNTMISGIEIDPGEILICKNLSEPVTSYNETSLALAA